jgi:hypothetical protein
MDKSLVVLPDVAHCKVAAQNIGDWSQAFTSQSYVGQVSSGVTNQIFVLGLILQVEVESPAAHSVRESIQDMQASPNNDSNANDEASGDKVAVTSGGDGGKRQRAPCGARFARMLRCVEQSGSAAACSRQVDAFLSCERAVFNAARRAYPKIASPHPPFRATAVRVSDPKAPSPPPPRETLAERMARDAEWLWALGGRAIIKQGNACASLAESLVEEGAAKRLWERCGGIILHGAASVKLVAARLPSRITEEWERRRGL